MIQINLLPQVKRDYLKANRTRRTVTAAGLLVIAVCALIMASYVSVVQGVQRRQLTGLDKSIQAHTAAIQEIKDIDKVLTIQNQLASITPLHESKPAVNRLPGYIATLTPRDISISSLSIDMTTNTLKITGSAPTLEVVNRFADTLKFTDYKVVENEGEEPKVARAFSNVVLQAFSRDQRGASYTLSFAFDPLLFKGPVKSVALTVPTQATTRSVLGIPTGLPTFGEVPAGGVR